MKKLRWKQLPKETRMMSGTAGRRPTELHDGAQRYAMVSPLRSGQWYWVAGWSSGIPHKNTCHEPDDTVEEAKAHALAYVKLHLGKSQDQPPAVE